MEAALIAYEVHRAMQEIISQHGCLAADNLESIRDEGTIQLKF